ncbi:hypothetical protein P3342_012140 [Pyrenophora teres f. teres]|nr:hypothetical protein P3342_012140 [Pyrenophora teres f. teres]
MARLSAPANETPKTERKSNRFRGMFKHRPDSSASSSPATLTKASQTIDSSPLPSPTVKPGFQQIGLLPSERPSFSSQVNTGISYLDGIDMDESAIMDGCDVEVGPMVIQDEKTESLIQNAEENADSTSPRIIDFASTTLNNTPQRSSPPLGSPYKSTGNMHADINPTGAKLGSVGGKGPLKCFLPPKPDDPERQTPCLGQTQDKNTDMLDFNDLLERCRTSLQTAHDNFNNLKLINAVADYDSDSIASESSSGNAAEENLLLHARYREFIRKQIAMALREYDGKQHGAGSERSAVARVTIDIDLGGVSTAKAMQVASVRSDNALFAVNSSIGPFTITHARIARDLQLSIVASYVILLIGGAFLGPGTLVLAVWRMAVVWGMYAATVCRLGWTERLERDVLLAPVFFAFSVAQGLFAQMAEQTHMVIAGAVADGLHRNGRGEEVGVGGE